jgi:hypothetical protein
MFGKRFHSQDSSNTSTQNKIDPQEKIVEINFIKLHENIP